MLIVKNQTVIDCLQLPDAKTRDDKTRSSAVAERPHNACCH